MFGRYGTAQDLGDKIAWEGGFAEFFGGYTDDEFIGTPIEAEVKEYLRARAALEKKLEKLNVRPREDDEF